VITSGLIGRVVFVAVMLNCCCEPGSMWLGLHFVWGSPRIEVQAGGA